MLLVVVAEEGNLRVAPVCRLHEACGVARLRLHAGGDGADAFEVRLRPGGEVLRDAFVRHLLAARGVDRLHRTIGWVHETRWDDRPRGAGGAGDEDGERYGETRDAHWILSRLVGD